MMLKTKSQIDGKKYSASFFPMSSSAFLAFASSAGLDSANLPASSSSSGFSLVFSAFEDKLEDGTGSTASSGVTKTGFLVVVGSGPKAVGALLQLSSVQLRRKLW